MKNQVKKPIAIFLLFAGLAFSHSLKAQAIFPYTITNNLNCHIICSYTIYDAACTPLCGSTTSSIAGLGGFISIPNTCGSSAYMIEVTVDDINSTPINTTPNSPQLAPVTGDCPAPGNFTDGGNCSGSCSGAATWTISWTTTNCTVN